MKYTISSKVNLPREQVVAKFMDPDAAKHWMEGFHGMEMISGEPGSEGSVSNLTFFKGKKNEMVMKETILAKKLPDYVTMQYETPQMTNTNTHRFTDLGNDTTQIDSEQEFIMNGFFMKLMGTIGKGMFKKQSKKYQDAFKAYAEQGKSVLD